MIYRDMNYEGFQRLGLLLGPACFAAVMAFAPDGGASGEGAVWRLSAVILWMLIWWVSEAIPLAATALLPIVLLPVLEVRGASAVMGNYAHPLIILMFAGLTIALAMQRAQLHKRIVVAILRRTGTRVDGVILGFMLSSALLSMWLSNTATTAAMLPIALSFIAILTTPLHATHDAPPRREDMTVEQHRLALTILLGIAYAANIGGTATLIGTAPNALFAGFMSTRFGLDVDFLSWMMMSLPFTLIMLFVMWLMLTRFIFPSALRDLSGFSEVLDQVEEELGEMSREEKAVAILFGVTVFFWVFRRLIPLEGLDNAVIGMAAVMGCFAIPVRWRPLTFMLRWQDMRDLSWGVLILLGGGLALGDAMTATGLSASLGHGVIEYSGLGDNIWMAFAALGLTLTEFASNTAMTATLLPVISEIAADQGHDPLMFGVPLTLATSCAFMMPMATPPNALVFSSGYIRVAEMIRAGFWINIVALVLLVLILQITVPFVAAMI